MKKIQFKKIQWKKPQEENLQEENLNQKKSRGKRFRWKKPDAKAFFDKIKHLTWADVKEHYKKKKEHKEKLLEERRNSTFAKKMRPIWLWMNRFSIVMHFLLSCFINFFIEVFSRHSLFEAWEYMVDTPLVFLYNSFLICMTFSVVYLVRRRIFVRFLISVIWLIGGFANGYLLTMRVTPFNAQDLVVLSDAITLTTNYFSTVEIVLLSIASVAIIIWLISMWKRGGQYQGKMHHALAAVGVVVSCAAYLYVTDVAIDNRVISNYFGNIAFAYEDYGFPYCFVSSVLDTGIDEPAGYSEATMRKISNNGAINVNETGRSESSLPNIIFVQLESYFDPTEVEWLQFSEDPIPNLRKMSKEYSSGYFKAPSIGAGTANTEFEVLTGMSMRFFGPGEYPYKTYAKMRVMESAATALRSIGYGAEALHNNGGNFYSRAQVFNHMGFDHYTSKEFMNILQLTEKGWATDDVLSPHIMDSLDTTEGTDFVMTISVQGHGDYPTERVLDNPRIIVGGIEDEGRMYAWEYYVNMVYEMDKFAGELVAALEERGEPTVVVFYGDHLPTMGLQAKDVKSKYLYNTNYVIWDNIGLEKKDGNYAAYQIMAEVLDRLDIHAGTVFNYHQQRKSTKNYLADLELLQYDILYGKQYVYEEKGSPITEGHMAMGVRDTIVSDLVEQTDGSYSFYGENFTKQTKVYINGEKQETSFLNNTRVDLRKSQLNDGDVVMLAQVGSSSTIFRTSKKYEYRQGSLVELPESGQDVPAGRDAFLAEEG